MAPPRKRSVTAPVGTQVAATATRPAEPVGQGTIRVAAFGDSVMWGQGLRREERFSQLICNKLKTETGRDAQIVWDMSRSGSEIRATEDQRRQHVDRYIGQSPNFKGMLPFIQGTNDSPAAQLYGEVPCTFPTVRGQVRMLPIAEGRTIEIALVDGGINDVAPEDIVNPQAFPGEWIEHWDGLLRSVGHEVVGSLINDVRTKCPNALIMYFGLHPTVSYVSNRGRLRELFKFQFDNDFQFWLNKHVFHSVDVNELINEFQTRGEWLAGRWGVLDSAGRCPSATATARSTSTGSTAIPAPRSDDTSTADTNPRTDPKNGRVQRQPRVLGHPLRDEPDGTLTQLVRVLPGC